MQPPARRASRADSADAPIGRRCGSRRRARTGIRVQPDEGTGEERHRVIRSRARTAARSETVLPLRSPRDRSASASLAGLRPRRASPRNMRRVAEAAHAARHHARCSRRSRFRIPRCIALAARAARWLRRRVAGRARRRAARARSSRSPIRPVPRIARCRDHGRTRDAHRSSAARPSSRSAAAPPHAEIAIRDLGVDHGPRSGDRRGARRQWPPALAVRARRSRSRSRGSRDAAAARGASACTFITGR